MQEQTYKYFILSTPREGVAHVQINRPEKLNAIHTEMWREYAQIFQALSIDSSVRAIVLSGAGERAFCAGLDLSATELASAPPSSSPSGGAEGGERQDAARRAFRLRHAIKEFQDAISAAEACEKPVVAAIHGIAFGLAIDIACCADVRLCAQDVKFSVKEVDIGIAADIGTLSRLPKIVGSMSWIKDVCYSARVFGADEALRHGFVSTVLPSKAQALDEALRLAGAVADKSPLAVQGTKAIINYSVDHSVSEGLEFTRVWSAAAVQAPDPAIAIRATLLKTKPAFAKL